MGEWVRVAPNRLRYVDKPVETPPRAGFFIQEDLKPYKAVAGDMAGKWINGRKQHREFLKRNGFQEVGNEHREFFEYGGKHRDHPFAKRNDAYRREDFERRTPGSRRRTT